MNAMGEILHLGVMHREERPEAQEPPLTFNVRNSISSVKHGHVYFGRFIGTNKTHGFSFRGFVLVRKRSSLVWHMRGMTRDMFSEHGHHARFKQFNGQLCPPGGPSSLFSRRISRFKEGLNDVEHECDI
jgi:hypothetical protein